MAVLAHILGLQKILLSIILCLSSKKNSLHLPHESTVWRGKSTFSKRVPIGMETAIRFERFAALCNQHGFYLLFEFQFET